MAGYAARESVKTLSLSHQLTRHIITEALVGSGVILRTSSEATRKYDDREVESAISNYKSGMSARLVGAFCKASEPTILRWLHKYQVDIRQQPDYGGDDNYFSQLDTDQKCYWFGFLAADGRAKSKYLIVNLGLKDRGHLETFKSHVNLSIPITEVERYHRKREKWYRWAHLCWGSVSIVSDLQLHGILRIKAGDYRPLMALNRDQFRSFLRGYFDGDGSIHTANNRDQLAWYVCGPHKDILEYMMSRCPEVGRHNAVWGGTRWAVRYMGNLVVPRICKWLYEGSTVSLPRKLDRAMIACGVKPGTNKLW